MNDSLQIRYESQKVGPVTPVRFSQSGWSRKDDFWSNANPIAKQSPRSLRNSDFSKKLEVAIATINASSIANATEIASYRSKPVTRLNLHIEGVEVRCGM